MKTKATIVVVSMNLPPRKGDERSGVDYNGLTLEMVKSYLRHTPLDIYVATNQVERFEGLGDRVSVGYYPTSLVDVETLGSMDESLKFRALRDVYDKDYDVYYLMDGDLLCDGWDQESWLEMINEEDVDVWTTTPLCSPNLANYTFLKEHTFYKTFSHREERVVYTNKKQLGEMLDLWEDVDLWKLYFSTPIEWWRAMGGTIGVMMGVASKLVGANVKMVKVGEYNFTNFEWVVEREKGLVLNRWWVDESKIDKARWKREGLEEKINQMRGGAPIVEQELAWKDRMAKDLAKVDEMEEVYKKCIEGNYNAFEEEKQEEEDRLFIEREQALLEEKRLQARKYQEFKDNLRLEQDLEEARAKLEESIPQEDRTKPIQATCKTQEELDNALSRLINKHTILAPMLDQLKYESEVYKSINEIKEKRKRKEYLNNKKK